MAQRALGNTGLSAFALGLGTVKIGRNRDVKYPDRFELPTDREVETLLGAALECGVQLMDTAPAYGQSEVRLGPFVRAHRDRIVLCSKAGEDWDATGSHHDFSAAAFELSVRRSLRRLQTDHLDLLLIHSDGRDLEILDHTDALEGLRRIKAQGLARAVGLSAKSEEGIRRAAAELDVVMAPFGLADPQFGTALAEARSIGCATLAIKVLGQGHTLAGAASEDPVQSALEFVLQAPGIDLALVGTANPAHLRDAAARTRQILETSR